MRTTEQSCPECGGVCDRVSVDIGVGIQYGPWGCWNCGWSEAPEYDCSDGAKTENERVLDPFGGLNKPTSIHGVAVLAAFGDDMGEGVDA